MYVLVSYDINTSSLSGKRRLRNVAKICLNYGQRVQNSVFECKLDESEFVQMKHQLSAVIEEAVDNLRFYRLGKNYMKTVDSMGVNKSFDMEGTLLL